MEKTNAWLDLFTHNQCAYESAVRMMECTGKAAVIHPTGTGKSFLGFKLAEEHPTADILWLSPSEYIYITQLENVKKALCGSDTAKEQWTEKRNQQITFFTYSKLMMNEEAIEDMHPDYIILDEFHRCGAAEWGKSVKKLLDAHKEAKILGLSATNIRYLDNQRDMAEEIFEGCIASNITLGEAIAKKILPAPVYVMSMYSYQEEWKRLQKRIESEKNPVLRKENEHLLAQLKRSLEQADGLDEIFRRHMKKKDGKYIVFCSGREHMEEMMKLSQTWFHLVDEQPNIYVVYYDNPATSQAFADFKADNSEHLKLLFCIDMLNEGVHVEHIDGVILLRPTVSPILYLQQIGRGLSAGKTKEPVIFDIVNNFESLYAIDAIQMEFENVLSLLPCSEWEKEKYQESFRVFDELKDCRRIFSLLNRNLNASWEIYYQAAKLFYEENGHLNVTKSYVTEDGLGLGMWLQTQRRVYAKKVAGNLSEAQIQRLEAIGMKWGNKNEEKFRQGCEALKAYKTQFGNTDVNIQYETEQGFALGRWVRNQRSAQKSGRLEPERKEQLDKLEMIWDVREYRWNESYEAAREYYETYGNADVPHDYVTANGIALGTWIRNQREIYSGAKKNAAPLTAEQIKKLEQLQIQWLNKYEDRWQSWYMLAKEYYDEHGDLQMRSTYYHNGAALGKWVNEIRLARNAPESSNRKLTEERIRLMDEIGMDWKR